MYYVLFRKTENLTPDEQQLARRGGLWLHTGISGDTRAACKEKIKTRRRRGDLFGDGNRLKIVSEEQL